MLACNAARAKRELLRVSCLFDIYIHVDHYIVIINLKAGLVADVCKPLQLSNLTKHGIRALRNTAGPSKEEPSTLVLYCTKAPEDDQQSLPPKNGCFNRMT